MKLSALLPLLAILPGSYASADASPSTSTAPPCRPTHLANGDFEFGSLKPWSAIPEDEPANRAANISTNAYQGKYSVKLTLIYGAGTDGGAPLVDLTQYANSCGAPLLLTYYYKIKLKPWYDNSFAAQIYDGGNKHVYVDKFITFNDTAIVDSEGNEYGKWHRVSILFHPGSSKLIFSFITDGDYHGTMGTSSVFVDSVSLVTPP